MQAMNLCQALGDCKPGMGVAIDVEEESNAVGIDSEVINKYFPIRCAEWEELP